MTFFWHWVRTHLRHRYSFTISTFVVIVIIFIIIPFISNNILIIIVITIINKNIQILTCVVFGLKIS
jgi:hypothetical protein